MTRAREVHVEPAGEGAAAIVENLMQFYLHDMSEVFPIELGADGRYEYPSLPRYWSDAERHKAFLLRADGQIAGFALVTVGSPASDDPSVLDLAELFVLRQHRRTGVGKRAATALFDTLGGRWIVRVSERSPDALRFWTATLTAHAGDRISRSTYVGSMSTMTAFAFGATARDGGDK